MSEFQFYMECLHKYQQNEPFTSFQTFFQQPTNAWMKGSSRLTSELKNSPLGRAVLDFWYRLGQKQDFLGLEGEYEVEPFLEDNTLPLEAVMEICSCDELVVLDLLDQGELVGKKSDGNWQISEQSVQYYQRSKQG
ncbi:hypothetical protein [Risungbinella massiliensis]|uniref:hypothetical protein n=1 Tax=Risungbinella massiliensis TaxID=1329796 RepID=UPI0011CBE3E0|nr:hypothetical protein [Risungbinella massiliensis]